MSKNLFETYEVNGRQYTDNLGHNAFISIPKEQYIEYEQLKEEIEEYKRIEQKDLEAFNNYESILTELEEWLKEEIREYREKEQKWIKMHFMDFSEIAEKIRFEVTLDKIQELKEKYK